MAAKISGVMTPKQAIEAAPKVSVRIPRAYGAENEKTDHVVQAMVNGVHQQFVRGDVVEMPVPLYLALRQTGRYDI